ncbi:MAG: hypothetical protein LUG95_04180 [Clostridiales bacterium]|nr:hypothetical protein [Clostridiales bacterium]
MKVTTNSEYEGEDEIISNIEAFIDTLAVGEDFAVSELYGYIYAVAGIDATVVSVLVGVGYVLFTGIAFTTQVVISIVALVLMGWLCAMVGYDKVIQAISQFKTYGKDD